jgi:4-alpha-glucanotransferase
MIYHNSHWSFYRRPFGAVPTETGIRLRLAVSDGLKPESVFLRMWRGDGEELVRMSKIAGAADIAAMHGQLSASGAAGGAHSARGWAPQGMDAGGAPGMEDARGAYGAPGTCEPPDVAIISSQGPGGGCAVYECEYAPASGPGVYWYYFVVNCAEGGDSANGAATVAAAGSASPGEAGPTAPPQRALKTYYCGNNGEMLGGMGIVTEQPPWSYQITVYDKSFKTPAWFRHGVMYQVFPDRFFQKRRAPLTQQDAEKKRPDYILHGEWGERPAYGPDPRTGEVMNNDFFGGNLAGIAAKLPYLKELGISVLYLNPIFESYSNHRYDTGNYMKVDPLLGTSRGFRSLCSKAGELGVRVILDGVFSHTGCDSLYFNKYGRYRSVGAYQSKNSKYRKWYNFKNFPDEYECWWNIDTLPNVNESDESFLEYVLNGEDSVIKHWLRLGASGWRLDVVDELPDEFLRLLRENVKSVDEDAIIIGEVWEDASTKVSYGVQRQYFHGFELDSVMNYVFRGALTDFMLGGKDAGRFGAEMLRIYENYPRESFYALMNLIGGHDVARILTVLSEPPEGMTRDQKAMHVPTREHHETGVSRLKLMSLVQMTFPGVPSVYYGDEAGMTGFEDPFNRGTFPWGAVDGDLQGWFKRIIALRNAFAPLRAGSFEPVIADGDVYAYVRAIRGGRDEFGDGARDGFAIVAVNRGASGRRSLAADLTNWGLPALHDWFGDPLGHTFEDGTLRMEIAPLGCRLLTYPAVAP